LFRNVKPLSELLGFTTQKTMRFILITVRNSNPTIYTLFTYLDALNFQLPGTGGAENVGCQVKKVGA
jgi:hypothetical protein